jgi:hypothetical protein
MQRIAEAGQSETGPMQAALSEQDRLIVKEFLTELDELEQQVFWLTAEGMRYRAIAPILGIPVNEARKASRSCEQKRERFQLLYDTGRLCGYRSASIQALQRGELTSAELAARAFAHLDACAQCRAEHKTNSRRLGRTFQDQLAAVLPLPTLVGGLSWLRRPWLRVVTHLGGGLWERTAALIGAGGAGAKLTAGLATVAVVAGGAIGATRATEHRATPARPHTAVQAARATTTGWVPSATTPHHDLGIKRAGRDTRAARPRTQAHAARLPAPSPTLTASGGQDDAQREFGPETAAANGGASPEPTGQARPPAEETAGREFGI